MIEHAAFDALQTNARPGQRAAVLYKEAQTLADENVDSFIALLQEVVQRSWEISEGGDIYAIGIRDICKKLGEQAKFRAQAIASITHHDVRNGMTPFQGSLDEGDLAEELALAGDGLPPPAPPAPPAAPAAVSFSPFAPLAPVAAEPKIVPLHRAETAIPESDDFSDIAERLAAFSRRAGAGFEGDFDMDGRQRAPG